MQDKKRNLWQLKAKNDRREAEVNRAKRKNGPKSKSNDFTLVGTRKAGGVAAGLRDLFFKYSL